MWLSGPYSFQNDFPNRIKTGIISSLPMIITRLSVILLIPGSPEKLLIGPTVPSPGPIPAMHVATEVADVTGSEPFSTMKVVPTRKIKK